MLGFFKPLGISISQASFKSYSLQIFLTNLLFFFYCSSWASLCVLTAQYFLNIYVIWSDFFTLHFLGSPKQNPKHLPFLPCVMGFLGGSVVKNLPPNAVDARDMCLVPGSGRSPGEGNATRSSILSWKSPWTEEGYRPRGHKKSDTTEWLIMHNLHMILVSGV